MYSLLHTNKYISLFRHCFRGQWGLAEYSPSRSENKMLNCFSSWENNSSQVNERMGCIPLKCIWNTIRKDISYINMKRQPYSCMSAALTLLHYKQLDCSWKDRKFNPLQPLHAGALSANLDVPDRITMTPALAEFICGCMNRVLRRSSSAKPQRADGFGLH